MRNITALILALLIFPPLILCAETESRNDGVESLPKSAVQKYEEFKKHEPLNVKINKCAKAQDVIYKVSSFAGFSGESYYYGISGEQVFHHKWTDEIGANDSSVVDFKNFTRDLKCSEIEIGTGRDCKVKVDGVSYSCDDGKILKLYKNR